MNDAFALRRFVEAQQPVYEQVCRELRAGDKRGHWIWFIFPQVRGLGASAISQQFGIGSLEEAAAYLAHPVLGARLEECTHLVLAAPVADAVAIFGSLDAMKFRSSMTLFARAAGPRRSPYAAALDRFFAGEEDSRTLVTLGLSPH